MATKPYETIMHSAARESLSFSNMDLCNYNLSVSPRRTALVVRHNWPTKLFEQDDLPFTKLPGLLSPHTGNIPSIPITKCSASIHLLMRIFLVGSGDYHQLSFLSTVVVECPQNVLAFPNVLKCSGFSQMSSYFPLILIQLHNHADVSPCCSRLTIGIVL